MPPRPTTETAPAKVNVTLHVTGRRADGYHLLDSLVMFADIGDRLTVAPGPRRLAVTGPRTADVPDGPGNLVLRAADLIGAEADITLEKRLPVAAGIGGGSSDAAACLRALARMTGRALPEDVLSLGADVPVCLVARAARMQGIGDRVTPLDGLPTLDAVLVNPGVEVSTPVIFKRLENPDNAPMPMPLPGFASPEDLAGWLASQRNDLEAPALAEAPVIGDVLRRIAKTPECRIARMSGSGATCFGLYPDASRARAAAEMLTTAQPGWWVAACRLS
ncbi:4-(cytidine 5'-diphospho)-2-C-methyl-D-erythritol kinase [Roseovarius sp. D22-M7]|uniref:4-(cytidine 5'-diphospho)-2-C-methyl-D-erythritol kinase n=1 Tax=Roseovarius sp. D22-M7 TaxID=3127116 RepID=UPI00300FC182